MATAGQLKIVAVRVHPHIQDRAATRYDCYAFCPLTTVRNRMLLAEFDHELKPASSFRFLDTTKERRDMWWLKRRGLPFMHWNLMLKGRA